MQIAPWVFPLTKETASVPRMCGEKICAVSATTASVGSPPRVRRKDCVHNFTPLPYGITPACAGKSCGLESSRWLHWDHPPRVRGKVTDDFAISQRAGITPACAGKRARSSRCRCGSGDHPRVCGEKPMGRTISTRQTGSPPRVRGKVKQYGFVQPIVRITPACAGKSAEPKGVSFFWRDHPRVCGEKSSTP